MIKNKSAKKALIDADLTIVELSKITGYTQVHLSNVINDKFDSVRVRKVIALAVGKKFEDLWPKQSTLS